MKLFRSSSSKDVTEKSSKKSSDQEKGRGRRRNFRFLRSVDQKKRMNTVSINKTRAHAKELAMAYNDPPLDTPTSTTSSNVHLLSRTNVATSVQRKDNNFFDPFGNGPQSQDPFPPTSKLDQQTATTIDSFDNSSNGSDLDLFAQQHTKPAKLDDFMGRQQQRNVITRPRSSANSNSVNALARRKIRSQTRVPSDHSVGSGGGSVTGSLASTTFASQASFVSQTSVGSSSEPNTNFFDMDREDGGFTFDAFGLDASQVERDVNDAMQELATDGIRGFSFFQQDSDQDSEFASQHWDSPDGSRVSSPDEMAEGGFEDGFRVTPQKAQPPSRGMTPPRWEKQNQQQKSGFANFDGWGGGSDVQAQASEAGASSVFGGTKSDFVPTSSSSPFQASFSKSKISGNRSDHGGASKSLNSISLDKVASPRSNQYRKSSPGKLGYNGDVEYDEDIYSDDGMQDELAKEFAQEFVKRLSPRHGSSPGTSQGDEYSDGFSDYGAHSDFDQESDYAAPSPSNFRVVQRGSGAQAPQTTKSSKLSFRDRYDSSKPATPSSTPVQSYRARAAQKIEEEVEQASESASSNRNSYGSLKSSYNAAKATSGASSKYGRPGEEKKNEDDTSSDAAPKRGNIKAKWQKWENKSKPAATRNSPVPVTQDYQEIVLETTDSEEVEMLMPETVERRNSLGGNLEADIGRKSDINKDAFSRLRRETEPAPISPFAHVTLRKTVNKAQLADLMPDDDEDEADASPAATLIASSRPVSYRQQHAIVEPTSSEERGESPSTEIEENQVQRKLTYRERRELELKREAKEKANNETPKTPDTPKKDVAALIRKRIAANKQRQADLAKQSQGQVSDFRNRLKPIQQQPKSQSRPGSPETTENNMQTPSSSSHFRYSTDTVESPDAGSRARRTDGDFLDQANVVSLQAENADLQAKLKALESKLAAQDVAAKSPAAEGEDPKKALGSLLAKRLSPTANATQDPKKMLGNMLGARLGQPPTASDDKSQDPKKMLGNMLGARLGQPPTASDDKSQDPKKMLGNMLGARLGKAPAASAQDPKKMLGNMLGARRKQEGSKSGGSNGGRPALKDDPKYAKFFKMLKLGMPKEQVQHAMTRDGLDSSLLDQDPNQPAGLPLKEDPKYAKYFKMLKLGIPLAQVKHGLERDGLNPDVMDQDPNLPASAAEKNVAKKEPKKKDTHRRARLHWKTMKKVVKTSIWGKIDEDESMSCIDIDEDEFKDLFQAELGKGTNVKKEPNETKKGVAVRVIDAKRANNGGIILARIKMNHDRMADAVECMDIQAFTAQQIESIIEYLPTKEERELLEKYMVSGGQDAAEKFKGLCECEKFMVSMMTVKHAKRKVNALLFKIQFASCLESIAADADMVDEACKELKNSGRLRQLLGIVLQFGNRLNTAGSGTANKAGAFTLDSLLKLNQAKAFDKKTTFLHYIVLIVQRNNENLLNFSDDLQIIAKAERVYWDQCLSDLEDVENQLENVRRISLHEAKGKPKYQISKKQTSGDDDSITDDVEMSLEEEVESLRSTQTGLFTLSAIKQVSSLRDKVDSTAGKFQKLLEYFGEDESGKQPHELFTIFSKFSRDFKKAKEEVARKQKKKQREERKKQKQNSKEPTNNDKSGKPTSKRNFGGIGKDLKKGNNSPQQFESNGDAAKKWPKVKTWHKQTGQRPAEEADSSSQAASPSDVQPAALSPSRSSDTKEVAKANFRDQARHRRLRQMQDRGRVTGTPPKPVTSSYNRTPIKSPPAFNKTPVKSPGSTSSPKPPVAPYSSPPSAANRNIIRNRRRLMDERRRRSTPIDKSSPWQSPKNVPTL